MAAAPQAAQTDRYEFQVGGHCWTDSVSAWRSLVAPMGQ